MDLEHADLGEGDDPGEIVHVEVRGGAAAALADTHALDLLRHAGRGVLLVEAGAPIARGAADEAQGPIRHVRHHEGRDRLVVAREPELGDRLAAIEHAVRMREPDPGHRDGAVAAARDRARRLRHAARLAHDLGGRLVLAEALERGMAQQAVAGPLGERDLGHQLRLHPVRAARGRARAVRRERGGAPLEPAQARAQALEGGVVEAGADAAGVDETAVAVVHAEEQRAKLGARTLRVGIAADHELLPGHALHLEPRRSPAGRVGRVPPLGDDALEAQPAGAVIHALPGDVEVLGVAEVAPPAFEQTGQPRLALHQRQGPQVGPVEEQQVEGHVDEDPARLELIALLERLEPRDPGPIQDHDLAVEQRLLHRQRRRGLRHRREPGGPVLAIAGQQLGAATLEPEQDAVAVELDLVHPLIAGWRAGHQGSELGRDPRGQRHRARGFARTGTSGSLINSQFSF